ncbi:MAG: hypothetical protein H6729_11115 [Deltaproteobacteria bacterium]|nr:hypothetical protein [Deltaproteobacteria bacterium]
MEMQDVRAALGEPTSIEGPVRPAEPIYWLYGLSRLQFRADRLVGWSTVDDGRAPSVILDEERKARVARLRQDAISAAGRPMHDGSVPRDHPAVLDGSRRLPQGATLDGSAKLDHAGAFDGVTAFDRSATLDVVLLVMGVPHSWYPLDEGRTMIEYGTGLLTFDRHEQMESWSNLEGSLRVSMGEPEKNASPVRLGSTTSAVIATMGTPMKWSRWSSHREQWCWDVGDRSCLSFRDERVVGWENRDGALRVTIVPERGEISSGAPQALFFDVGDSADEVARLMGTPLAIEDDTWFYLKDASVSFKAGRVVTWDDPGGVLRVGGRR